MSSVLERLPDGAVIASSRFNGQPVDWLQFCLVSRAIDSTWLCVRADFMSSRPVRFYLKRFDTENTPDVFVFFTIAQRIPRMSCVVTGLRFTLRDTSLQQHRQLGRR